MMITRNLTRCIMAASVAACFLLAVGSSEGAIRSTASRRLHPGHGFFVYRQHMSAYCYSGNAVYRYTYVRPVPTASPVMTTYNRRGQRLAKHIYPPKQ